MRARARTRVVQRRRRRRLRATLLNDVYAHARAR